MNRSLPAEILARAVVSAVLWLIGGTGRAGPTVVGLEEEKLGTPAGPVGADAEHRATFLPGVGGDPHLRQGVGEDLGAGELAEPIPAEGWAPDLLGMRPYPEDVGGGAGLRLVARGQIQFRSVVWGPSGFPRLRLGGIGQSSPIPAADETVPDRAPPAAELNATNFLRPGSLPSPEMLLSGGDVDRRALHGLPPSLEPLHRPGLNPGLDRNAALPPESPRPR